MINTELWANMTSKRVELAADYQVYRAMGDFILANAERCKQEKDYCGMKAWLDAMKDVNAKLEKVAKEYGEVVDQLAAM